MTLDLDDPTLLFREDVLDDPRPFYDQLRREAPVWQIPGRDTFVVVDPDLIRDLVGRPAEFSSNLVSLLHTDAQGCPASAELAPLGDPTHVLATADPPAHTEQRRLLQPHLSPRAVAELEPELRSLVDRQLAPVLAEGRGDLVAHLANPLPAMAICRLLGVPTSDAEALVPSAIATGALLDGVTDPAGMEQAGLAALELTTFARARLEEAAEAPPDSRAGLVSVLVDAIEAGRITADQAQFILVQLFSAGTETTSSLIATAIESLARDPDHQDELRSRPDRIPDAIEGFLEADGPFQFHYRFTTTETTLTGTPVPAGSRVLLMWAGANRPDPTATEPDGTSGEGTDRAPHLAFGRGLHFCIGAPLARSEARLALERLLAQTSHVGLDPERPPTRQRSIFLRRHLSLPVIVEPA